MRRALVALAMPWMLIACQSLSDERPALLQNAADVAVIGAELKHALGSPIRLAENAFVDQSWVVVEAGNKPAMESAGGRVLTEPRRLELRRSAERCVIVDSLTGKRIALPSIQCTPVSGEAR